MKAFDVNFLSFIKKSPQFAIPIYQRNYSWTERECRQLWDDIVRTGSDDSIAAHFVGSIVYIEQGIYSVSQFSPLLVIDGQQRLTTMSLLFLALIESLEKLSLEKREPIDGFSPKKIRNYYLMNPEENDERQYKLILSYADKDTLIALINNKALPKPHAYRVVENYNYFKTWMEHEGVDLAALCKGMLKLVIVEISLNRQYDNPQLIFESMNSTGRELTQADLIRNFILMDLEPDLQTRLYKEYWRPIEIEFGQEFYNSYFDSFMRHYLTIVTGDIPRINDVYEAFKQYSRDNHVIKDKVESFLAEIQMYAKHYCAMAFGTESDKDLIEAFNDLRDLKVEVAYPFLLEVYHDYHLRHISKDDLLKITRMVESYVFRRAICSIPTNSLNKTFATFSKSINKDRYVESVMAQFLLLPSYRRFPGNDEFKHDLQIRDLYNFRNRSYWLRRIENHERKERVKVEEYTIEHIMPQNENMNDMWKQDLGEDWKRIHSTWLHTLGNLTLTGYNSEYSDRPFSEKRDMAGGFADSPLKLNQGFRHKNIWNEEAIKERALQLSEYALSVWQLPDLPPMLLSEYEAQPRKKNNYNINSYQHLHREKNRDLFEALRQEVMSLDPVVSEEYLKLYIAYKAESNFVDVTPKADGLLLTLNLSFPEINDPKGICKDVTNIGHWGNGDVEVFFSSSDQLQYIMWLVRQSFERQINEE